MEWKFYKKSETLSIGKKHSQNFKYELHITIPPNESSSKDYMVLIKSSGEKIIASERLSVQTVTPLYEIELLADTFIRHFFIANFP